MFWLFSHVDMPQLFLMQICTFIRQDSKLSYKFLPSKLRNIDPLNQREFHIEIHHEK